jgi:uncharacterized cofD-like protein
MLTRLNIINVMTQPGETDGFSAWDHLKVLIDHTDPRIVNACLVNTQEIPKELIEKYEEKGAQTVELDLDKIRSKGYEIAQGAILRTDGQVRHDSDKLAALVFTHYASLAKASKV